jgi:MurNAc alpha-1-phosphate uridylyltransferase
MYKAMILAAGRGERMRPLTDAVPKPLLEAGGKPLIAWQIGRLAQAGFRDLVINHAHLGRQIESALGDGAHFGVRIAYSDEGEALETAGGIAKAMPLLGHAPFLVVSGDVYSEYEYERLVPRLRKMAEPDTDCLAYMVMVDNPPHHAGGDFVLRNGLVRDAAGDKLTFSGIGLYRPEVFAGVRVGEKLKLRPVLEELMKDGRVGGERFAGRWEDVGTPERLAALDAELRGKPLAATN